MNSLNFKFGLELELCDIDTRKGLPQGFDGFSSQEYDLAATSGRFKGLPNDPSFKSVFINGELNTTPTDSIEGQIQALKNALELYPEATVNHRIDTHLHISLPEFKHDVELLKKVLTYIYKWGRTWCDRIYPSWSHPDMLTGDKQFVNINAKTMPEWRYNQIMASTSVDEFIRNHSLDSTGKYNARMGTRYALNMIAVKDHGSIEVRANWPILNPDTMRSHFQLIQALVTDALHDEADQQGLQSIIDLFEDNGHKWQEPQPYDHYIQCAYRYSSIQTVGHSKYIVPRWIEFKKMWEENPNQFKVNGWYNTPEYAFNKDNYTPMTLQEAIDQGLV